jgi:hypothetical protein
MVVCFGKNYSMRLLPLNFELSQKILASKRLGYISLKLQIPGWRLEICFGKKWEKNVHYFSRRTGTDKKK